ncbi:unnamed protein product [Phaedon cochleariae]|uniref:Uncharacterized protein n=1 Tax=Phaedon cochleariae TaxID=80249 RepID=A0A9N9SGU2_PHACE|nr:unnamed protein product [Phaedon cochleariae]
MPKPEMKRVEVKCYSSSKSNIKCLLKLKEKEVAVPIEATSLRGTLRNIKITLLDPIDTINEEGKRITLSPGSPSTPGGRAKETEIWERSASIQSLNEVIDGVKTTQMQEISNTINNRNQIKELENIVNKLISFMSKKYPRILAKVFGGEYKTKWMNDEILGW